MPLVDLLQVLPGNFIVLRKIASLWNITNSWMIVCNNYLTILVVLLFCATWPRSPLHLITITITITIINIIIIDLAKVSSPPLPLPRILCIKTSGSALQEKSITPWTLSQTITKEKYEAAPQCRRWDRGRDLGPLCLWASWTTWEIEEWSNRQYFLRHQR